MDHELRKAERLHAADPLDDAVEKFLVTARRRAGYVAQSSNDLRMEQKEIQDRLNEVSREMRDSAERFEKMCEFLFSEYPDFEIATILLSLPSFMDGDPLRPDGALLIDPTRFADYGLVAHDEIYSDFDMELYHQYRTKNPFTLRPSTPNAKLSQEVIEEIGDCLWPFYEFWQDRFGLNCRVDIYRNGLRQPNEENRSLATDTYTIEIQPYNCGY